MAHPGPPILLSLGKDHHQGVGGREKKDENANRNSREDSTLERGVLEGVDNGGERMCQLFTCFREVSHVFVM